MTRYTPHRRKKDTSARANHPDNWITCGVCQKRSFPTMKAARAAQRLVRAANDRTGMETISADAELRPYWCDTGAYHIGHETPAGRANRNDPRLTFLDDRGPRPARGVA
jgi:hypothetical protein